MPGKSLKKTTSKSKSSSKSNGSKSKNGKVKAYCLPCKKKVSLDEKVKIIKRKLPNGNTVTILCGKCLGCKANSCKIIANSKS